MNNARLLIAKCSPRNIKLRGMVSHYGTCQAVSCQGPRGRLLATHANHRDDCGDAERSSARCFATTLESDSVGIPCERPVVECIQHDCVNSVVHPMSDKDMFAVGLDAGRTLQSQFGSYGGNNTWRPLCRYRPYMPC